MPRHIMGPDLVHHSTIGFLIFFFILDFTYPFKFILTYFTLFWEVEIARFCLNIPVLARKRPLLFWMLYGDLGAKSYCSSFFPHAVLFIFCSAVETTVKGRTPQLPGAVHLPYEEWQDSDVQFNSRFFLKAGEGGMGAKQRRMKLKTGYSVYLWFEQSYLPNTISQIVKDFKNPFKLNDWAGFCTCLS